MQCLNKTFRKFLENAFEKSFKNYFLKVLKKYFSKVFEKNIQTIFWNIYISTFIWKSVCKIIWTGFLKIISKIFLENLSNTFIYKKVSVQLYKPFPNKGNDRNASSYYLNLLLVYWKEEKHDVCFDHLRNEEYTVTVETMNNYGQYRIIGVSNSIFTLEIFEKKIESILEIISKITFLNTKNFPKLHI